MSLSEIVNVSITSQTAAVARASFGIPLILTKDANITTRYATATTLSAIAALLAEGTDSDAYDMAVDLLAQNPRVVSVAIGNVTSPKILTDDAGTYTAGNIKVTVNGTEVDEAFSVDKDTTLGNLATSLTALPEVASAVYNSGGHTITITPAASTLLAVSFDISGITGTMTVALSSGTASENYDTALAAISVENDSYYGVCIDTVDLTTQKAVADYIETVKKVCVLRSNDSDVVDVADASDTTSIAAYLKSNALVRTASIYSTTATDYPDAAYLGRLLPRDPGTYTGMFKSLASITVDNLTSTQSTNARDKNANVYEEVGGVNIVREGIVGSGRFIDLTIFIDWLEARITENVYSLLVNSDRVPYTDDGILGIKSKIDEVLQIGQNRGAISPHAFDANNGDARIGGFETTVPTLADTASADRVARVLRDVYFVAYYSGAVHQVIITGVVTV